MSSELLTIRGVTIDVSSELFVEPILNALRGGWYECHEADLCNEMIMSGDRVLEVGGGCGFISSYIYKNKAVQSIAVVEANPEMTEVIKNVHSLNGVKAVVHNEFLGPTFGTKTFYKNLHFWSSDDRNAYGGATPIEVPMVPWSHRIDEIKPTAIVMDIEGGELDLLSYEQPACIEKYIIEFHPSVYDFSQLMSAIEQLYRNGFYIHRVSGQTIGLYRNPGSEPSLPNWLRWLVKRGAV